MRTFWIVILIINVALLARGIFNDRGLFWIILELFWIGVAIYHIETHGRDRRQ